MRGMVGPVRGVVSEGLFFSSEECKKMRPIIEEKMAAFQRYVCVTCVCVHVFDVGSTGRKMRCKPSTRSLKRLLLCTESECCQNKPSNSTSPSNVSTPPEF